MAKQMAVLLALSALLVVAFVIWRLVPKAAPLSASRLAVGENIFEVEVADTMAGRAQGLSGHAPLSDKQGMLFIFPLPGPYGFWMKEMTFPIDIIWIRDGKVIGLAENLPVPSGSELPTFYPPSFADQVLEINAGLAAKLGIKTGDRVVLQNGN